MSEEILIRQGAPTLAGIKTGSLFPCPCEDREALLADIRQLNRRLSPKGLCLLPLRFLPGQALLYLYRPAGLRRDLRDVQASELLRCRARAKRGISRSSCALYQHTGGASISEILLEAKGLAKEFTLKNRKKYTPFPTCHLRYSRVKLLPSWVSPAAANRHLDERLSGS